MQMLVLSGLPLHTHADAGAVGLSAHTHAAAVHGGLHYPTPQYPHHAFHTQVRGLEGEVQKLLERHKADLEAATAAARGDAQRAFAAQAAAHDVAAAALKERLVKVRRLVGWLAGWPDGWLVGVGWGVALRGAEDARCAGGGA
eukprot:155010-Chlamydomonas_euryale.AAC.2